MKRYIIPILLILLLCCSGCAGGTPTETTAPTDEATDTDFIPAELIGTWTSASGGELDMTETFTFNEDGTLSAYAIYRGTETPTVGGSFTVSGHTLLCEVSEGVNEPYTVTYEFRIDGRDLYLTDDEGDSHFLRVS